MVAKFATGLSTAPWGEVWQAILVANFSRKADYFGAHLPIQLANRENLNGSLAEHQKSWIFGNS